jgi:hypothetical protein
VRWLQKLHRQQEKELLHDGQHIQVREYTGMVDRGRRSRETRERGGPCRLLKQRQMETQVVHMKEVLP